MATLASPLGNTLTEVRFGLADDQSLAIVAQGRSRVDWVTEDLAVRVLIWREFVVHLTNGVANEMLG